jgi:hypothetical protein
MKTTDFNFAFYLPNANQDPTNKYKKYFIDYVQKHHPTLTIIGLENDNEYLVPGSEIQYAWPGSVISLESNKTYDIDWYGSTFHALENGVKPQYELTRNWATIVRKLQEYESQYLLYKKPAQDFVTPDMYTTGYTESYVINLSDGTKVEVFPAFIKIGLDIFPRYINQKDIFMTKKLFKKYTNVLDEITQIVVKY